MYNNRSLKFFSTSQFVTKIDLAWKGHLKCLWIQKNIALIGKYIVVSNQNCIYFGSSTNVNYNGNIVPSISSPCRHACLCSLLWSSHHWDRFTWTTLGVMITKLKHSQIKWGKWERKQESLCGYPILHKGINGRCTYRY